MAETIDLEGPITFGLLSERVARAHGFQRTGSEIKGRIWLAASRSGRYHSKTPDDREVFWPQGSTPSREVAYRSHEVVGYHRDWKELPYQEKLGLVRAGWCSSPEATAYSVAQILGVGRVSRGLKAEVSRFWEIVKLAGDA